MTTEIDINFDFRTDTPNNKDPDTYSSTLRKYHKLLWSKALPNGINLELVDTTPKTYLHHKSNLGDFSLSSDAITNSYKYTKKMSHIISQLSTEEVGLLFDFGCTIGAYIIFPSKKVNNKMTINGARGTNSKIKDRFDLTLECIRLYYLNKPSPLSDTFERYSSFFNLFQSFNGYVEYFLLQDLVSNDLSSVEFFIPFNSFEESPLPCNVDEYRVYRNNTIKFIISRNQRHFRICQ